MDLRYSEADEAFRKELRAWLDEAVPAYPPPPPPGDWVARRAYDTGWQRQLHDAGYAGLSWPEEDGGRGLPVSQQLVYLEEYAASGAPYVGITFVGNAHAGPTLIAEGSDEQRRHHLPRILRGEAVWCQGFSEPGAGSDLASLRTRAVREGDEYVVSGQKIWSTRAQVADWCELLVRTDPDAPKHEGITWLILDMHQPGVEVRPMRTIDGESHFCEVFLDEARVPVSDRVGAEHDGWRVTNVTLRFERGTAFAQHIITLRSQLRRLVGLAGAAADDPGFVRRVGGLDARAEGLWRMTQRCVTEAEASGVPSPLGSAVKLGYSELGQEIARLGMEILGARALGTGGPETIEAQVVHDYLWSFQSTIAAGTSQIQRNLVAERILGLPQGALMEPWTFGVEPLAQTERAATVVRRVIGLVLSAEGDEPAIDRLIADLERAETALAGRVPTETTPRIGDAVDGDGRVYLDHARDVGTFNPAVPAYEIAVDGDHATGTVTFPLAYEGPPGLVHGGFLALFVDCIVQHHSCDVGVAGKTTSLALRFRRPTPLLTPLAFTVAREVRDDRIRSLATVHLRGKVVCEAEVEAIAGVRASLPAVGPRRAGDAS